MSKKKIIPVMFEIQMINCFAFLSLISISKLEDFIREVFQVPQFGMQNVDRLIIGLLFIAYITTATEETSKMPQASETGFGATIALLFWSASFSCLLTYENGKYFSAICNKDTALLYVSFSCISFISALMHPKREEVTS